MSYKKNCNRCNQQILMDNFTNGKWQALELDGSQHTCKEQLQPQPQKPIKKQFTLEDLDFRLQRLEAKISEVFGTN